MDEKEVKYISEGDVPQNQQTVSSPQNGPRSGGPAWGGRHPTLPRTLGRAHLGHKRDP